MSAADKAALRLTGVDNVDHMHHAQEHRAGLAALISAAVHHEPDSPARIAEGALRQLSVDLTILAEALSSGTDLVPDILTDYVNGLSSRASAAAELSSRINDANPSGPASKIVEAAE